MNIRAERFLKTSGSVLTVSGKIDGHLHTYSVLFRDGKALAAKETKTQPSRVAFDKMSALDCRLINQFLPKSRVPKIRTSRHMETRLFELAANIVADHVDDQL